MHTGVSIKVKATSTHVRQNVLSVLCPAPQQVSYDFHTLAPRECYNNDVYHVKVTVHVLCLDEGSILIICIHGIN